MKYHFNIFISGFFLLICLSNQAFGQKFGYIDAEFILTKMPEYKKAEKELEQFSVKWQQEIEAMKKQVDKMKKDYSAEEVLFTEDMKKERLDSIAHKERQMVELQKKYFGFDGMLFLKRAELMKPLQDKLYDAVEKVAKTKQLQIIFDKSSDLVMIYANPIHDYTDYVLEELGLGDPKDTVKE